MRALPKKQAGIGWPLLPVPDAQGRLRYPDGLAASVRQSIEVLLSTRPKELMLHPEYGAGIDLFLHEPDNLTTRRRLQRAIEENLERWESRIELDRVDVAAIAGRPGHLRVELAYRLRRTGQAQSLGLTLETGAL